MFTRDPGAPFGTPNGVIGRQGRNELTLSFRPHPYLHRLLTNESTVPFGIVTSRSIDPSDCPLLPLCSAGCSRFEGQPL